MILNGEKLLIDLLEIERDIEKAFELVKTKEDWASLAKLEAGLSTTIKIRNYVESGQYTIKEQNQ